MSEVPIYFVAAKRRIGSAEPAKPGTIEDAVACFTTHCRYEDHGIGLEFTDEEHLTDFFRKTRELYPDYFLQVDQTFLSGEHVITEWTLQATITEPFYAGLTRRIPISIAGVNAEDVERLFTSSQ